MGCFSCPRICKTGVATFKKAETHRVATLEQLEKAWDSKKSFLKNMKEMGLSSDPNKTIENTRKKKPVKMEVITALEAEANAPKPKTLKLPTEPMKFCVYMIEKHGDNYNAMAKDPKNYYQDTPAQIRNKIKKFQKIPIQWNAYLRAKGLLNTKRDRNEFDIDINDIMEDNSTKMDLEV